VVVTISSWAARAIGAWGLGLAICGGAWLAGCTPGPINAIDLDPTSLTNGLLAHWSFDEGMGSVLHDQSGNGRDGAIVDGSWIPGRFASALHFAPGQVTVPSFPQPMVGGSWSVAGWVRALADDTGVQYTTMVSTELLRQGGWEMNLHYPMNPLYQFGYWIGPGESDYIFHDSPSVAVDSWVHLVAVRDGTARTLSFYRNGAFEGLAPAASEILPGTPTLYLARWPPDPTMPTDDSTMRRSLIGDLDDIAIYNRALAPSEVAALYRSPVPNPP
jgi:Concanavalin A-like lectin/glucanases superfamily